MCKDTLPSNDASHAHGHTVVVDGGGVCENPFLGDGKKRKDDRFLFAAFRDTRFGDK